MKVNFPTVKNFKNLLKPTQKGSLNIKNELNDVAQLYLETSMQPLREVAKKTGKDITICQKGQDLVLINTGNPKNKLVQLRLSEIGQEYASKGRSRDVKPEDFTKIVLPKIYKNI